MANRNTPAIVNDTALATDDMFSDARVEMIRSQIAKGSKNTPPPSDEIFAAFLDIAKRRNLDPLAKQVSLIAFKGTWTIITTIDGYRALAEQTGQYAGSDAAVFTYAGEKTAYGKTAPETATVTVHKLINGNPYPFSATVYFEEYSTGLNNWATMPRTMLAKVAESHALRKAFPAVMSGMYEESEMDQAIEGTARVVDTGIRVDSSGEIHEITGRAERPQHRPAPPITATVEHVEDTWESANTYFHTILGKHKITEDEKRAFIRYGGVKTGSAKDMSIEQLRKGGKFIDGKDDPKAFMAHVDELMAKKDAPKEVPAETAPDTKEVPAETAPDTKAEFDAINAEVNAVIDAQVNEQGAK